MAKHGDLIKWFWDQIEIKATSECWPWKRRLDHNGYGASRTLYDNGYPQKASRTAFQIHYGIDPKGKVVMHICDNRVCCNPHHLRLGTQWDNMQDRKAKGKYPKGSDHANSKLTDTQRVEIYHASGTHRDIAKRYGLKAHHVVGLIKRGPPR